MPITDLLERNHKLYGGETALVEINPEIQEKHRVTWKEYELIEPASTVPYRREITWGVFDEKANRVANMLLSRGVKKGDKVAILLMNCLEWLPIYFGILKAGAIAVPGTTGSTCVGAIETASNCSTSPSNGSVSVCHAMSVMPNDSWRTLA